MSDEVVEIYRKNLEKRKRLKLSLNNGDYEVGKTYISGYWQEIFKVLQIKDVDNWMRRIVVCQWEDGMINSHCTPISNNDFIAG